jgi:ABC-type antimicrobial peptide transport system permease subunit
MKASPQFANLVSQIDLREYSSNTVVNFNDRLNVYLKGNYDQILQDSVPLASKITELLSPFAIEVELPIVSALEFTRFANTFISLVLNLILLGLLYLSSFVIFNIMQIIVDSKVYDSAVLRTLGMTQGNMIAMMTIYALV